MTVAPPPAPPAPAAAPALSSASPRDGHADPRRAEGDAAVPVPAAAGLLPPDVLQSGEVVILLLKPSPLFIFLECLKSLSVIVLLAAAALLLVESGAVPVGRREVIAVAILLGGTRLFWQFLEWLARFYVLTDRRVIRIGGVLRVGLHEAALKQITDTALSRTLREQVCGLGTLGFATAGTGPLHITWRMVARPYEVHQTVLRAIQRYR